MKSSVSSTIKTLSQSNNRQPISKITFDASGLSESDLDSLTNKYFTSFANDGGVGASEGFLAGQYDSAGTEYTNSSLGIFDYDTLDDGSVILLGVYTYSATQWAARIKRIETPSSADSWDWDGATALGPYDGVTPTGCMVWYIGGASNKVGAIFVGTNDANTNYGTNDIVMSTIKMDDELMVGGSFTNGFGVDVSSMVRYNISEGSGLPVAGNGTYGGLWPPLGSPYGNSPILCMAKTSDGRYLYVGGHFSHVGTLEVNSIARYDTLNNEWASLGNGVTYYREYMNELGETITEESPGRVHSIVIDADDNVWIGGYFNRTYYSKTGLMGVYASGYFSIWNHTISQWFKGVDPLTENSFNGKVNSMYRVGDMVYACGAFTNYYYPADAWYPPGGPAPMPPLDQYVYVAKRNGINNVWEPLLNGVGFPYGSLTDGTICADEDYVYVTFGTTVYQFDLVAETWAKIADCGTKGNFNYITVGDDGNVYVGGDFGEIDSDTDLRYHCYYDTSTWTVVGSGWPAYPTYWWQDHPEIYHINYIDTDEIYVSGTWGPAGQNGPDSTIGNISKWNGTEYESLSGDNLGVVYMEFTDYTTYSSTVEGESVRPVRLFNHIKPDSRNSGTSPTDNDVIGVSISTNGLSELELFYISGAAIESVQTDTLGLYSIDAKCSGILTGTGNALIFTSGTNSLDQIYTFSEKKLYMIKVSGINTIDNININSVELVREFINDLTSIDVNIWSNKLIMLLNYGANYYTDSTGMLNNMFMELVFAYDYTNINSIPSGTVYSTRYGGYGELDTIPGTLSLVIGTTLLTVGGYGTGTTSPYGPSLIKQYGERSLLEISDHITSWSLSHSEPNTAAQLSLSVNNEFGVYNDTVIFQIGSKLTLYAGFVDSSGTEHWADIGVFEIQDVANDIEFGKQVINIEASDFLYKLNNTQHASESQPYIHYDSQIITKVNTYKYEKNVTTGLYELKKFNPFDNNEIVSMIGSWQYMDLSNKKDNYIKAMNTIDSGDADASRAMLHVATAGAQVEDVEMCFSVWFDAGNGDVGGAVGAILAGNPANIMDDSLMLVIRPSGSTTYIRLTRTLNRSDSLAPSRDDYYYATQATVTISSDYRNKWHDFIIRKQNNVIYVYRKDSASAAYDASPIATFSCSFFNPKWYSDLEYRANIGLFAACFRTSQSPNRAVFFKNILFYSLKTNNTAAELLKSIATQAYKDTSVDVESGFEKRIYDDFDSATLDTDKWTVYNGAGVVSDSIAPKKYALKLPSAYGYAQPNMTGHNRQFKFLLKNASAAGGFALYLRMDKESDVDKYHAYKVIFEKSSGKYKIRVEKQASSTTYTTIVNRTISNVSISSVYQEYTVATVGNYVSIWYEEKLLVTFEMDFLPSYKYDVSNENIVEYYAISSVGKGDIYIAKFDNDSTDLVISGLSGIIGFTINPGDYYGEKFQEIAETCSALYFMRNNVLVCGLLVPDSDKVDVFSDEPPFDFSDTLFKFGDSKSAEDWYTAVQTIGGDGKFGPLVKDSEYMLSTIYYLFAEGITDETQLYDMGHYKLIEKKRNRRRENFGGYSQPAIELRDRVNIIIHKVPDDESSEVSVNIIRMVNGYTLSFDRTEDSVNLSMEVELVE